METARLIWRICILLILVIWAVNRIVRWRQAKRLLRSGGAGGAGSAPSLLKLPFGVTRKSQPNSRSDVTGDLSPGRFAPLSRDETLQVAKGLGNGLFFNRWFGRRDLIPPVSDDRTLLIDRSMVGLGLVTPEELERLHEIGDRMLEVHDKVVAARQAGAVAGEAAVERDRKERAERKAQKIAEAAERRRKRAEEVVRRRETDIVFLGRGVSAGLADRRSDVEKLQQAGLPILCTPAEVAQALGLPIPRLRWLAFHSEAATRIHYIRFQIPKRGGGVRELAAPHVALSQCQHWVLDNILNHLPAAPAAHGFVAERSVLTNARPHVRQDVVVNTDLKDFFPSITFPRVRGAFQELGYSPAAATVLALLCTESPRMTLSYDGTTYFAARGARALPQGACTSPALSNLICRRLDSRLVGAARSLGWNYTRYADDLTFSASGEAGEKAGYLLAKVRHVVQGEGFEVNEKKTRIQRRSQQQSVTGVVVNERPGAARTEVRRLRALLHNARQTGLAAQNRDQRPDFEMWLRGKIAWISMLNPEQGRALSEALEDCLSGSQDAV